MNVRRWVYTCGPIDDWFGWRRLDDVMRASFYNDTVSPQDIALEASIAHWLAACSDWEGDGTWQVSALPDPERCCTALLFAVKQSNNGTTFIISPWQLPWLHGDEGWFKEERTDIDPASPRLQRKMRTLGDWLSDLQLDELWAEHVSRMPELPSEEDGLPF